MSSPPAASKSLEAKINHSSPRRPPWRSPGGRPPMTWTITMQGTSQCFRIDRAYQRRIHTRALVGCGGRHGLSAQPRGARRAPHPNPAVCPTTSRTRSPVPARRRRQLQARDVDRLINAVDYFSQAAHSDLATSITSVTRVRLLLDRTSPRGVSGRRLRSPRRAGPADCSSRWTQRLRWGGATRCSISPSALPVRRHGRRPRPARRRRPDHQGSTWRSARSAHPVRAPGCRTSRPAASARCAGAGPPGPRHSRPVRIRWLQMGVV